MATLKIELGQMSTEEAYAWIDAIADKYGTDLVFECLKMREHRFEVMSEEVGPMEGTTAP